MPIQVTCPGCHKRFQVSEKFAGQKGPCPSCKGTIQIPALDEQVTVHAPQEFGPADSAGRPVLKPIARKETRFSLAWAIGIGVASLAALGVAVWARGRFAGDVPAPLLILGSLALGPPLAVAGYTFLRDDELEPYRGRELWVRGLICGAIYALLWGIYAYLVQGYIFAGAPLQVFQVLMVVPLLAAAGAFAAHASLEVDLTNGFIHYGLYLLVTVLLRLTMNMSAF